MFCNLSCNSVIGFLLNIKKSLKKNTNNKYTSRTAFASLLAVKKASLSESHFEVLTYLKETLTFVWNGGAW